MGCVMELQGDVVESALDTHGSWGICIAFEHTRAQFILDEVAENVRELAIQQHGCRVVQSVLQDAAKAGMDVRSAVSGIISSDVLLLASHRFANYAVQVALRQGPADQRQAILEKVRAATTATNYGRSILSRLGVADV